MRVRTIMQDDPITVDETTMVAEIAETMRRSAIRHVLVTRAGKLVGIISDRDVREVVTPALLPSESRDLLQMSAGNLMSADVLTVSPDANVTDVIDMLLEGGVGAVPVVDSVAKPVGIVSYVDVLRAARAFFDDSHEK